VEVELAGCRTRKELGRRNFHATLRATLQIVDRCQCLEVEAGAERRRMRAPQISWARKGTAKIVRKRIGSFE
jgi:hypothetical protein